MEPNKSECELESTMGRKSEEHSLTGHSDNLIRLLVPSYGDLDLKRTET